MFLEFTGKNRYGYSSYKVVLYSNIYRDQNMMKKLLPVLLLIPLLAACASMQGKSRVVIMQHPYTMDFQNCEVGKYGFNKDFKDQQKCVDDLKNQGYIVWGER